MTMIPKKYLWNEYLQHINTILYWHSISSPRLNITYVNIYLIQFDCILVQVVAAYVSISLRPQPLCSQVVHQFICFSVGAADQGIIVGTFLVFKQSYCI